MARVRTIPKAAEEIKEKDPNTHISKPLLRKWVKEGRIPTIPSGGKFALIDLDKLEEFLTHENS